MPRYYYSITHNHQRHFLKLQNKRPSREGTNLGSRLWPFDPLAGSGRLSGASAAASGDGRGRGGKTLELLQTLHASSNTMDALSSRRTWQRTAVSPG